MKSPIRLEPLASGRAPALHASGVSHESLPLNLVPSVSPVRGGCGRFPSGALRTPSSSEGINIPEFRTTVKDFQKRLVARLGLLGEVAWRVFRIIAGLLPAIHPTWAHAKQPADRKNLLYLILQGTLQQKTSLWRSRVDGRDEPGHDDNQQLTPQEPHT